MNNQAVLLLTHQLNDLVNSRFSAIDLPPGFQKFLLVDSERIKAPESPNVRTFSLKHLTSLGYRPISNKPVPGSNHFPTIEFIVNSDYEHVWTIEFDVLFNGRWSTFFTAQDSSADFLTASVKDQPGQPHWVWWSSLKGPASISEEHLLGSFNPVYRLSRRAAAHLKASYLSGWRGHHEVTMATLLQVGGFSIEDFGGKGRWVRPQNVGRWYRPDTYRFRDTKLSLLKDCRDVLFHPVKSVPMP